jgi:hypothetical protein
MKNQHGMTLYTAVLLLLFFTSAGAQTIYFCEGVDEDGFPITQATTFTIPDQGGYLYVLVRLPYEVACDEVRFEIYRNGKYDNTVYMDTDYDWVWFWKKITFYKEGTYRLYVYDCFDYELVTGKVNIEFR